LDRVRRDALVESRAPRVDGVTKADYAEGVQARLEDLSAQMRRLRYRPQPARRTYIPKDDVRILSNTESIRAEEPDALTPTFGSVGAAGVQAPAATCPCRRHFGSVIVMRDCYAG